MKKKNISILIVLIISIGVLFLTAPIVLANTSGTGGIGDFTGTTPDGCGLNNERFGFKLAVFTKNNELKNENSVITIKTYDYGSVSGYEVLADWLTPSSATPTKLYDYLKIPYNNIAGDYIAGDYSGLKKLLDKYNLKLSSGDYVLIEPITDISPKGGPVQWFTFRNIVSITKVVCGWPFHENYSDVAMRLANAAKVGSDITVGKNTYKKYNGTCDESTYGSSTSKEFCGYNNNKYLGIGILVVREDQINPKPKTATLTVNKYKKDTTNKITGYDVTVQIYSDSKCTNTITDGTLTFKGSTTKELNRDVYYVKETNAPHSYIGDDTCHKADLSSGDATIDIYNYQTCASEFDAFGTEITRANREYLFEKYGYTRLLDFKATSSAVACTNTRRCGIETKYTCSEISVNYGDFDGDNLSCYNPKISAEGSYCVAEFTFDTSFLKTFESKVFKSGQLIYLNNLPTLTFKKICYNLQGTQLVHKTFVLDNYINSNQFKINGLSNDGDKLTVKEPTNSNTDSWKETFTLTRKACISKIDGKEVDMSNCDANYGGYNIGKFLYKEALVPKFTNSGNTKVYPSLELNDDYKSRLEDDGMSLSIRNSDKCTFEFEKELINPKLELMFRTIDTTNPFPGNNGVGRLLGANWCDDVHLCTIKYSKYVDDKIFEAPNSKGLVTIDGTTSSAEPKYKIVLNANVVKEIRKYNKEHSYEEVEYECAGNNCENKFLKLYQSYFQIYKGQ